MSARIRRNPAVAWRDEPAEREAIEEALRRGEDPSDRGWVILVDRGEMHELNLVAGDIWCLADGSRTRRQIVEELARRYDAPAEEIAADVGLFLDQCRDRGWLTGED